MSLLIIGYLIGTFSVFSILFLYNLYLKYKSNTIIASKTFNNRELTISVDADFKIYVSAPDIDIENELLYEINKNDE